MAKIQCMNCGGMTEIGNSIVGDCEYCGSRISLRRISALSPVEPAELPRLKTMIEHDAGESLDGELAIALCYLKSGNFVLARKKLAALIDAAPECAEVYYYYVLAMFRGRSPGELTLGEAREFAGHLQTAMMLDETFVFPRLLFALICVEYYAANDLRSPADGYAILEELSDIEVDPEELEFFRSSVNSSLL